MKKALFLLLDNYADWECAYLSSTLNQREDWSVGTLSLQPHVRSLGGFNTTVDYIIGSEPERFDLLILVGGTSWNNDDKDLLRLIKTTFEKNIAIGAICAATRYLAKNGFLNNYNHTGNPASDWSEFEHYHGENRFFKKQAVRDKNLVTANGTGPIDFMTLVLEMIEFDTPENIEQMTFMNKFGFYEYSLKYGNPFSTDWY